VISFVPRFRLHFLSMHLCYARLNELLHSHILSHPSHLNFPPPPSLSTS
jgi:hypothetical protein